MSPPGPPLAGPLRLHRVWHCAGQHFLWRRGRLPAGPGYCGVHVRLLLLPPLLLLLLLLLLPPLLLLGSALAAGGPSRGPATALAVVLFNVVAEVWLAEPQVWHQVTHVPGACLGCGNLETESFI